MKNLKLITTLVLTFAFLFAQVGNVAAAPLAQDPTPITGTIDTIVVDTDANGDPVVVVTLLDGQSYSFSVETAASLELLALDPVTGEPMLDPDTGLPQADLTQEGQTIEFLPTDVIPDETEEEDVHPISALLATFFFPDDDSMAAVIDSYHNGDNEDGVFGFGVIAQALWMAKNADSEFTFEDVLQAKKDGSGTFTLSDGTEITYNNWGQLKKALLEKHNSLGSAKHAEEEETLSPLVQENGQGNGKGKGNNGKGGNGKGKGHNK
ncbi:MAG TPA: hypothetical protein VFR47_16210 [Anaerolineales bacterium]|nr:hypothetical protein [Anaerolineales bacterium]